MLGAGGSARAAVWALIDAGAAEVRVWNRTAARAERLCEEIGGAAVAVREIGPADFLVHCTSSGLDASAWTLKQLPLTADALRGYNCVVDFVYTDTGTELARMAGSLSIPVVDGFELLVGQGALSFELFTDRSAPVDAMRSSVRRT